ncbi:MAG: TIGR01212 family radical SAM protein [Candidatus Omnitrophica bacterium]|jgi:radical SAM protein (TIGR01212 family)|nr:TIGR01212 family radical SAM protein [Candidatus Omnitrophota bacterium]
MKQPFYSFNDYLKKQFGHRVHRISLDAGFSCPNLDGTLDSRGCIFCNNKAFSHFSFMPKISLEEQISNSINFYRKRLGVNKYIAYFQAFTNTYSDLDNLHNKYDVIKKFPEIVGLFISTRPDCIDEDKIKLIDSYKKKYLVWLEYGLQTTYNNILALINRHHTYEDFLKALDLTRKYKIDTGIHLILGLPGVTYKEMIEDAQRISRLDIQGIKFHILQVLKNTSLEQMYNNGKIKLLQEEEYVKIICDFLEILPPWLVILRLVSTAAASELIGPLWTQNKQRVLSLISEELKKRNTYQGYHYEGNFN